MRPPSPAQRAVQVTFVLKGHLENAQISYLRVGALLVPTLSTTLRAEIDHAVEEVARMLGRAQRVVSRSPVARIAART